MPGELYDINFTFVNIDKKNHYYTIKRAVVSKGKIKTGWSPLRGYWVKYKHWDRTNVPEDNTIWYFKSRHDRDDFHNCIVAILNHLRKYNLAGLVSSIKSVNEGLNYFSRFPGEPGERECRNKFDKLRKELNEHIEIITQDSGCKELFFWF